MATAIKPGESYGFFTDTSICIGCKACEVACKEWNQLQGNDPKFLADSFDNTGQLDDQNWRHVKFIDNVPDQTVDAGNGKAWLMMSDVCKHCKHASCMDVCPTGAIIRTEFDTVFIQQDVCNGCRNCLAAWHSQGSTQAQLYGRDDTVYGGLNAFFLLMDKPETYGLPNADNAKLPTRNNIGGYVGALLTGAAAVVAGLVAFRRRGMG